jgi:hypothetical protein
MVPSGDGRLSYRPRRALSEADRDVLARNRTAILAFFESDPVGWRAAAMATQVRWAIAIPLPIARPGLRFEPGSCCSCGEPRNGRGLRCTPCVAATVRVLGAIPTAGARA